MNILFIQEQLKFIYFVKNVSIAMFESVTNYRAFSLDFMAAMLGYSQQKNLDEFFCFGN